MIAEVARHGSGTPQEDFCIGEWRISPTLNLIARNGSRTRVEPKVMQVLVYLSEHAGNLVSKEQLISAVWPDTFVSDQALTTAIWQLRQALGESARRAHLIHTIPKTGYRLAVSPSKPDKTGEVHDDDDESEATQIPPLAVGRPIRHLRWPISVALVSVVLACLTVLLVVRTRVATDHKKYVTLAVLPFANLSGNAEQEYFSDGITEEMILQLGRARPDRLGVIARSSVMPYKNSAKRINQIADELRVAYLLEGSVRRQENRLRVTVHLIDATTQAQLWGEVYEQDCKDILLVQAGIARSVAEQLKVRLTPEEA